MRRCDLSGARFRRNRRGARAGRQQIVNRRRSLDPFHGRWSFGRGLRSRRFPRRRHCRGRKQVIRVAALLRGRGTRSLTQRSFRLISPLGRRSHSGWIAIFAHRRGRWAIRPLGLFRSAGLRHGETRRIAVVHRRFDRRRLNGRRQRRCNINGPDLRKHALRQLWSGGRPVHTIAAGWRRLSGILRCKRRNRDRRSAVRAGELLATEFGQHLKRPAAHRAGQRDGLALARRSRRRARHRRQNLLQHFLRRHHQRSLAVRTHHLPPRARRIDLQRARAMRALKGHHRHREGSERARAKRLS